MFVFSFFFFIAPLVEGMVLVKGYIFGCGFCWVGIYCLWCSCSSFYIVHLWYGFFLVLCLVRMCYICASIFFHFGGVFIFVLHLRLLLRKKFSSSQMVDYIYLYINIKERILLSAPYHLSSCILSLTLLLPQFILRNIINKPFRKSFSRNQPHPALTKNIF